MQLFSRDREVNFEQRCLMTTLFQFSPFSKLTSCLSIYLAVLLLTCLNLISCMSGGCLLLISTLLLPAVSGVVIDLDKSNFDQVFLFTCKITPNFVPLISPQYVNGDKHAFVEFYAPCEFASFKHELYDNQ